MIPEELIREFHERTFGEEMTRVNFLPKEARWAYVRALWKKARERAERGDAIHVPHADERIWDLAGP